MDNQNSNSQMNYGIWQTPEQLRKKYLKAVFKQMLFVGILLLITFGVSNSLGIIITVVPFFSENLSEGLLEFIGSYSVCMIADIIAIFVGMLLFRHLPFQEELFAYPEKDLSFLLIGILAVLGAVSIGSSIFTEIYIPFYYMGHDMVADLITLPEGDLLADVLIGLYVCLIGPVLEETLFRGVILKGLEPYGKMTAIVTSAFAFAVFHFNPCQFFTPLVMGLLSAFITLETKSILPSMLAHILNNTLVQLPDYFFDTSSELYSSASTVASELEMIIGIIALLIFVYRYGRRFVRYYREEQQVTGISVWSKLRRLLLNPITMLLFVLYIYDSVLVFMYYFN